MKVCKAPYRFMGLWMAQNDRSLAAISFLLNVLERRHAHLARIIELGTCRGGLSVFLQIACMAMEAKFITYEIAERRDFPWLFDLLGIDYRMENIFNEGKERLCEEISSSGTTILICDNGHKPREFNTFASLLKPGDVIMAHDYAPDFEYFHKHMKGKIWNTCSIRDEQVEAVSEEVGLEPFLQEAMLKGAWLCRRKI